MSQAAPARRAALAAVSDARRRDGRIRDIIRTHAAFGGLSDVDRALATRLAVGAVAARDLTDELIAAHLKRPSSLEPRVADALRISAFELLFLDTPEEVAVSQGVELVRTVAPRAAGLANAVLRRVAEKGTADVDALRAVSALPLWLLDRIRADRGDEAAADLARANLEPAPIYVYAPDARPIAPFGPQRTDVADVYGLADPSGLYGSGLVQSGSVVVSDLAAQRICALVADLAPRTILEVGQGSATKSLILARRCDARITAIDVLPSKVAAARKRIARAGLGGRVTSTVLDGCRLSEKNLPSELDGLFDCVLLDAPCSGTGTMRRHPEIASALTPEGVSELAQLQARLLTAAASRVAPGGHLVYATCSVLAEENECVVDAFLESLPGAVFSRSRDDLQTVPASGSCDGHYCAVMKRGLEG